ncbi:MAG: BrnT family toxin, partial [Deltaproteobacteria bacterium]|nr:BrnT family toxin [Deltaproteobacteria bacterium]
MAVRYSLQEITFIWDRKKAEENLKKHGVSFEEASEVFFDPFYRMEEASGGGEERVALVGYSEPARQLHSGGGEKADAAWRLLSAR